MSEQRTKEPRAAKPGMEPVARSLKSSGALKPIGRVGRRRRLGWAVGASLSAVTMLLLMAPGQEFLKAPGTMNVGHEGLACEQCHQAAAGTTRQQLQANARYLLGLRKAPADFGNENVDNNDCLACHERPFDRHPVFRFNEPRFRQVRQELGAHQCESCHTEHRGAKVTVQPGYCSHCHSDLELEKDPLDVPHAKLVADKRFDTCLGCHDFHGNHERTTPQKLSQVITPEQLRAYFEGAASPYGKDLKAPPRQERSDVRK